MDNSQRQIPLLERLVLRLNLWAYRQKDLRYWYEHYGSWGVYKQRHPELITDMESAIKGRRRGDARFAVAVIGLQLVGSGLLIGLLYLFLLIARITT